MLCCSAQVEAELLELDAEGAIDRMSAVVSDVDSTRVAKFSRTLEGGGESGFVRPTKGPRVAGCAARASVPVVESAVLMRG